MMKVNIFKNGPGLSPIVKEYGSSTDWLMDTVSLNMVEFNVVNAYESPVIDIADGDAWIIMGSAKSVYDQDEWIGELKNSIKAAVLIDKPILGICFGHQILADCLGGRVALNDNGWELGSSEVTLTDIGVSDPIFDGFSRKFNVYESHQDAVYDLPDKVSVLADNHNSIQAFRYGSRVYGLQFHPEFYLDVALHYARIRYARGIIKYMPEVKNSDSSKKVINNFLINIAGGK